MWPVGATMPNRGRPGLHRRRRARPGTNPPHRHPGAAFVFEPLEGRLLLSADWLGAITGPPDQDVALPDLPSLDADLPYHAPLPDVANGPEAPSDPATPWLAPHDPAPVPEADPRPEPGLAAGEPLALAEPPDTGDPGPRPESAQVVFLDPGVPDAAGLLAGLELSGSVEVVTLDAGRDGIEQVTEALAGRHDLTALHFISHGSPGALQLGGTRVDAGTLDASAETLRAWGEALAPGADLLLYGCDVAAGQVGEAFVARLAELTGTDVAASDDPSGTEACGGDWQLETFTGAIETPVAISTAVQMRWTGLLADPIAYEGFDYADGPLAGQSGGSGWADAWADGSGADGDGIVMSGGLSDPSGTLLTEGNTGGLTGTITSAYAFRNLSSSLGTDGTTVWLSFLVRPDAAPGDGVKGGIALGGAAETGATGLFVGHWNTAYQIETDAGSRSVAGVSPTADTTAFLVAKIEFLAGPDSITVYVNPTPGLADPDSAHTANMNTFDLGTFAQVVLTGGSSAQQSIDEIRIGATYLDVAPAVAGANTPPTADDGTVTTDEDTPYTFSAADFGFSDDDGDPLAKVRITTLESAGTLAYDGVDVTLSQEITAADLAAGKLTFTPAANASGAAYASLGFRVHDGSEYSATAYTLTVDVVAVNDPPVNTVPGAQSTDEETPLVFTQANGNAIAVQDAEVGAGTIEVTLTATHGTVSLADRVGDELRVNETTARAQLAADVAVMADGRYVVVWQSDNGGTPMDDIYARVYAADGTPLTGEIRVNGTTAGEQLSPAVAINANGDFVVAWQHATGDLTDTWDVYARPFAIDGTPYRNELRVNKTRTDDQTVPDVGIDAAGNFAVAWQSKAQDGDGDGVYVRAFTRGGAALGGFGSDVRVNTTVAGHQQAPTIAMRADGQFFVAWDSAGQDGGGDGIYGQRFAASGAKLGVETRVNTTTADSQTAPTAAVNASGQLVVVWQSRTQDGSGEGIYAQRLAWDGSAVGTELRVNTTTAGAQAAPSVALADSGAFTVAWQSVGQDNPDGKAGIYLQHFDATGAPLRGERLVNTATADDQTAPAAGMSGASDLVVVWQSKNQDGDREGVYGQRFLNPGALVFSAGDGLDDASMTFQGTVADLNGALARVVYTPDPDYTGAASLTVRTDDLGSTGAPGPRVATDVVAITVDPVNDAPVLDNTGAPAFPSVTEDDTANAGELVSALLGASVSDVDDGALEGVAVTSLASGRGAWQYSTDDGASWSPVGAVSGTSALLLRDVDRLRFVPDGLDADTASVTYRAWDRTAGVAGTKVDVSANGDATAFSTATETASISVSTVNDAPSIAVPGAQTTSEDGPLVFSAGTGNPITVTDADSGTSAVQVTLFVSNGVLRLNGTAGLTFSTGDGTDDATMTFRGQLSDVNARLNGLRYTPASNYAGPDTLTIEVDDRGNAGAGGPLTAADAVAITVSPVNEAPVLTVLGNQSVAEDTDLPIGGISVSDIDADAGAVRVTVSTLHGQLTLGTTDGLAFVTGDGAGDPSLVFTGTLADVNAALATLTYRGEQDYAGADTVSVTVSDQGNTGSPGALTDSASFGVTISAVNDAPVISVPAAQSTGEDTALVFSSALGNPIVLTDVDAGGNDIQLSLSATQGRITLATVAGLSFVSGDGSADEAMTFRGAVAEVNAALDGSRYVPRTGYAGPALLQITVSDLGRSGSGGTLTDYDGVDVTVVPGPVNQAPSIAVPGQQATGEETPVVFSSATGNAISVSDDAGGNPTRVTLTATGGTLTVSGTTGAEFQVNTQVANEQRFGVTAMAANGDFVVVWQSTGQDGSGEGIFAQRYDASGLPLGSEFRVNTRTAGEQVDPAVAMSDGGRFVVVWASNDQDGSERGVFGQVFGADGTPSGSEFRVNTHTARDQEAAAVAMDADGDFVVVWQSEDQDGDGWGVYAQRFAADGTPSGAEFRINTTTSKNQMAPAVARSAAGDFVVVWQSEGNAAGKWDIVARRFAADGTARDATDLVINTITDREQRSPAVGMDDAGNFVVAWESRDLDYPDDRYGIYAQRFLADGSRVPGGQFLVNTHTPGEQRSPSVAMDGEGNFTIAWQSQRQDDPDKAYGVFAQRYDASGSPRDSAVQVNTYTRGDQSSPSVAAGDDGHLVVVWTSKDQDGSANGIFGQRYKDLRELALGPGDGIGDPVIAIQGTLDEINDALDGLVFMPGPNFDGLARLTIEADDLGNSGAGGALRTSAAVDIAVSAVNDAPDVTTPVTQATTQDTPIVLSLAGGNPIRIADPDAGTNPVRVSLTATEGALTLAATSGLVFSVGDGAVDATMTFEGTVSAVNAALDGVTFGPVAGFTGTGSIQVAVDDLGNTGSGTSFSDVGAVLITVGPDAVNQAPEVRVPNPQRTAQDTPLVLGQAGGNPLVIVDDAGTSEVEVTLTVANGTVSLTRSTGPETRANTHQSDEQRFSAIAATPDGEYVVVWQSRGQDGSGEGIYLQRFTAAGLAVGPETRVNGTTAGNQTDPTVAIGPDGALVVAWVSEGTDGDGKGIYARRFAADGSPLGSEFLVNTSVVGNQYAPAVALNNAGVFVIAWQGPDGSGDGIYFQRFDSAGVAQGEETLAHANPAGGQAAPAVGIDAVGNIAVAWQAPDANGLGVFARRFDVAGVAAGAAFQVNTGATASDQKLPAVAVNGDGTILIAWQGKDSNGDGVFAKVYGADGSVALPDFRVNTTEGGNQQSPAATLNADGRFAVVWQGTDASGLGVYGQLFDAAGTPAGAEFRLSATTAGDQQAPVAAMDGAGGLVASWTSNGQDADRAAVMAQRFMPDEVPAYTTGDGTADALVTLRGTLAEVNAALDGMTFTPAPGFVGVASIDLAVDDLGNTGAGGPLAAADTLSIVVGSGPLLDLDADNSSGRDGAHFSTTFVTGGAPARVADADAAITSPGTGKLNALTVTLTNPMDGASEVLSADTAGTLITASYAGHVLTLSNLDTVANYKKVLGTVRYENSAAPVDTTTRLLEVTAVSGALASNTAVAAIAISQPETDAPVLAANSGSTVQEGGVDLIAAGELRFTDAQPAASVDYLVTGAPPNGHLELTAAPGVPVLTFTQAQIDAGTLLYRHDGSETLADTFTFTVSDGVGNSVAGQSFSITVSPVNDAPLAGQESYSLDEDTVLHAVVADGVLDNDTDAEGQPLTAVLVTGPAHGLLTLNPDGSFTYTPGADYHGADAFTYRATDGAADSGTTTVTLTVSAVNDAPVAGDDSYTTGIETPLVSAAPGVLADDTDAESDSLTVISHSGAANGTVAVTADGSFTYTPNPGFSGADAFTYTVSDSAGATDVGTVTVTVSVAGNQAPDALEDAYATAEETPLSVAGPGVLGNDSDPEGDSLTAVLVSGPDHGSLALAAAGGFTYTPDPDFVGSDAFSYRATDGSLSSAVTTVTLTVTPVNDAPAAAADAYVTAEDTPLTVAGPGVLANDSDADGDALSALLVAGPGHGTLALDADGGFTYTPAAGFSGSDSFSYRANDGSLSSGITTVTLTVASVNDAPTAAADAYATDEDTPLTVAGPGVLGNDSDPDGDALTAVLVTGPAHGTLRLDADGGFSYVPDPDFAGNDGFTYRTRDGALSSTASVVLTVRAVDDGSPLAVDDAATTTTDTPVTLGVLDNDRLPDRAAVTAFDAVSAQGGRVVQNPDGSFAYTPPAGFHGQDRFAYTLRDTDGEADAATVTLRVDLADRPLVVLRNSGLDLDAGASVPVTGAHLAAEDPDAGPGGVRYVLGALPEHGILSLDGTPLRRGDTFTQADLDAGRVRYAHADVGDAPDAFTVTVGDGGPADPVPVTFTVRVQALEAAPGSTGDRDHEPAEATPDDALVLLGSEPHEAPGGRPGTVQAPDVRAPGSGGAEADPSPSTPSPGAGGLASTGAGAGEPPSDAESGRGGRSGSAGEPGGSPSGAAAGAPEGLSGGLTRTPATEALARLAAEAQDMEDLLAELATGHFRGELDDLRDDVVHELKLEGNLVASSVAMATGLSVGYVIWLVRGGVLLSTLLSSMPAWRLVDPLPVLAYLGKDDGEADGGESLESLVGGEPSPGRGRRAAAA